MECFRDEITKLARNKVYKCIESMFDKGYTLDMSSYANKIINIDNASFELLFFWIEIMEKYLSKESKTQ